MRRNEKGGEDGEEEGKRRRCWAAESKGGKRVRSNDRMREWRDQNADSPRKPSDPLALFLA